MSEELLSVTFGAAERVEHPAYARFARTVLEPTAAGDVASAHAIIERHADLGISLADASIVVLARRHRVRDVLTLDERHFRVLNAEGKRFRLLPADAGD